MTGISRQAMGLGLCLVLVAGSTLGCATFEQQVRENPKTVVGAAAGDLADGPAGRRTTRSVRYNTSGGIVTPRLSRLSADL